MKAVAWTGYGAPEVLKLSEREIPVAGPGEIRVRICATSVSLGDTEIRRLALRFPLSLAIRLFFGVLQPRRVRGLGQEFAGEVSAIGPGVTAFAIGDRVFGKTDFRMGAYAEYLCVKPRGTEEAEAEMAHMPRNLSFAQAAVLPLGGLEAVKYLRAAEPKPGQRMLIIGAGGGIGTASIQVGVQRGLSVTAVDTEAKLRTMREAGAAKVIDYTRTSYLSDGQRYDIVFDVVGKHPRSALLSKLVPGGCLILTNPRVRQLIRGSRMLADGTRIITGTANDPGDLEEVRRLAEAGQLRPFIDRTYTLDNIVEAHRYVDSGAKKGCVAVTV